MRLAACNTGISLLLHTIVLQLVAQNILQSIIRKNSPVSGCTCAPPLLFSFATPDFKSIVLFRFTHAFKRARKQIDMGACANLNRTTDLKSGVTRLVARVMVSEGDSMNVASQSENGQSEHQKVLQSSWKIWKQGI